MQHCNGIFAANKILTFFGQFERFIESGDKVRRTNVDRDFDIYSFPRHHLNNHYLMINGFHSYLLMLSTEKRNVDRPKRSPGDKGCGSFGRSIIPLTNVPLVLPKSVMV